MEGFNNPIQGYNGWNINQSYMTPSYMANFRPAYGTDGDRENPFARKYSLGESAWKYGPGEYSHGADVLSETSAHIYNMSTGVGDAAMAFAQYAAIPAAAAFGIKHIDNLFGSAGRAASTNLGAGLAGRFARGATGLLGRGMGAMGLGGLARAGAPLAGGLAAGASTVGGLAGAVMLPVAAGVLGAKAAGSMFLDPYISTRRGMDAMRANTANQFISGEGQSASGGFGMSATRAQEISQALSEAGQGDYMLSGSSYNEIADNMMRAGIFQEVGDMDTTKIVDGVKKATSVLKLISRITGDPDILNGIQTLATLKSGGLDNINQMESAMHRIRQASGASGMSVNQLMDTVGNQGHVMAQQQGLRGVTGLLASADALAGFTNARRAGIISGGQMQSLGGAEGMTQSLMQGAYQTMNSGYSRMLMQGRSSIGTGYSDAIGMFGQGFSNDPIAMQGDWYANQGFYKDNMLRNSSPDRLMINSLREQAKAMGQDPDDGMVLMAMAEAQGMDPASARAMAEADRARQDPLARMRMTESRQTSNRSDYASRIQQEGYGLRGIPLLGSAQELYVQSSEELLRLGASWTSPITEATSSLSDSWEETLAGAKGMATVGNTSTLVNIGDSKRQAMFVGRESVNIQDDSGWYSRGKSKLAKSDKYNTKIARLNAIMNDPDPKVSKAARKALAQLTQGDTAGFLKSYEELNKDGLLTGSKARYMIEADNENMRKAVEGGEFSAITIGDKVSDYIADPNESAFFDKITLAALSGDMSGEMDALLGNKSGDKLKNPAILRTLGIDPNELEGKTDQEIKDIIKSRSKDLTDRSGAVMGRSLGAQIARAARSDKPLKSLESIVDKLDPRDERALKALGISEKDIRGKSPAQIKVLMGDKAKAWRSRDMEDVEGGISDYYDRFLQAGFRTEDVDRFIANSGATPDALMGELNPILSNANAAFQRQVDAMQYEKDRAAKSEGPGTQVDWSNLRDVTDGIGKLGPVMSDNTDAIRDNTAALRGKPSKSSIDEGSGYTPLDNNLTNIIKGYNVMGK